MSRLSSFVQILRCLIEHAISGSRYTSSTRYSQALLSKHKTWCNYDLHWWISPQQISGTLRDEEKLTNTKVSPLPPLWGRHGVAKNYTEVKIATHRQSLDLVKDMFQVSAPVCVYSHP